MAFLVLAGYFFTYHTEKSPLLQGYGSDGAYYGHYAIYMDSVLQNHQMPVNLYERILPIYVNHLLLKAQRATLTPIRIIHLDKDWHASTSVINAYLLYNYLLFLCSCYIWLLITKNLQLTIPVTFASLVLLLLNFCNSKQYFYETVMLDQTVLLFGILTAYALIKRNRVLLFCIGIIAIVVNPSIPTYIFLLLLFPLNPSGTNLKVNKFWAIAIACSVSLFVGGVMLYYFYKPLCLSENGEVPTNNQLFPLSWAFIVLYVYAACFPLIKLLPNPNIRVILGSLKWKLPLLLMVFVGGWRFYSNYAGLHGFISDGLCDAIPSNLWNYFVYILRYSYARPGGLVASHFAYYGTAFIALALGWKIVCRQAKQYGTGALLLVLLMVIHALNTESRQNIFCLPILLTLLLSGLRGLNLSHYCVALLFVISFVSSKVWYIINPLNAALYPHPLSNLLYSRLQRYFMNLGPWMNDENFVMHLVTASTLLAAGYFAINTKKKEIKKWLASAKTNRSPTGKSV